MTGKSELRLCHFTRPGVQGRTGLLILAVCSALAGCGPTIERYDGSEYRFPQQQGTWRQARDTCAALGFHLADIGDAAESEWVGAVTAVYGDEGRWIGFNDRTTEGEWVWESGAPVTYNALNPEWIERAQDCASVGPRWGVDTGGWWEWGWSASYCDEWKAPICKRPGGR